MKLKHTYNVIIAANARVDIAPLAIDPLSHDILHDHFKLDAPQNYLEPW